MGTACPEASEIVGVRNTGGGIISDHTLPQEIPGNRDGLYHHYNK